MSDPGNSPALPPAGRPVQTSPPPRTPILLIAGSLLLAIGGGALALPLFESAPQWDWTTRTPSDLAGAEVIADVIQDDSGGFHLQAQGARPISLISPPLVGVASGRPCVEATIARVTDAQSPGATPEPVTVNLFWQYALGEPFRMEAANADLDRRGEPARVLFTPPIDAAALHRIGIQVTGVAHIRIHSIRMIEMDMGRRLGRVMRDLSTPEAFGSESVNFFKGVSLLGRGLNYYLVALLFVIFGIVVLESWKHRRRLTCAKVIISVLIPWALGDAFFSTQLVRRAVAESGALRDLDSDAAIRAVYGDNVGIAAEWLQIIPRGSRVCVLASDGTTTTHRLAYLCVPRMIPVVRPQDAEFIVLLDGKAGLRDERTLVLSESSETVPIRIIARWPGGALLERVPD